MVSVLVPSHCDFGHVPAVVLLLSATVPVTGCEKWFPEISITPKLLPVSPT